MSFWMGAMKGLSDWRAAEADRNRDEQISKNQGEEKIALTLLESDDPEVQMAGLSILQAAIQPPKRKKGIRGSIGEYESTAGLAPLLSLANRFRDMAEGSGAPQTPAVPGGAALPAGSPVEPKMQGGPNPGLLTPPAGAGAGSAFGPGQDPASDPDMPAFGSVPMGPSLNAPQAFAADQSISPNGTINMGQIAGRVSRDRGIPRPGERARLFWPTKASQAAASERAKFDTQIQTLQGLGATPQQILSAVLASQGLAQGAATTSGEEWVVIPGQTDPVLAFHYRDPRTQQAFMAYTGPNGQPTPLPPGTTRAPAMARAGAAGGASLTSYMDDQQMVAAGITEPGEWPPGLYKVQQKGDVITILPYKPPSPPPVAASGAGTSPRTGAVLQRDRFGNVTEVPDTAPQINPRITAAKSIMAAIREQERLSGLGTDVATMKRQVEQLARSGQYPALAALTYEQIAQLEKLDEMTPDDAIGPILRMVPTPPPGAGPAAAAPAGPAVAPGAKPGSALPPGWAKEVADEILRGRKSQPQPGVVQGRPPK